MSVITCQLTTLCPQQCMLTGLISMDSVLVHLSHSCGTIQLHIFVISCIIITYNHTHTHTHICMHVRTHTHAHKSHTTTQTQLLTDPFFHDQHLRGLPTKTFGTAGSEKNWILLFQNLFLQIICCFWRQMKELEKPLSNHVAEQKRNKITYNCHRKPSWWRPLGDVQGLGAESSSTAQCLTCTWCLQAGNLTSIYRLVYIAASEFTAMNSFEYRQLFPSLLRVTLLVGQQEEHPTCKSVDLLVVTIWLSSFACLIAPVVTTAYITLGSNKIRNVDILVPANPGPPGKWPLKRTENTYNNCRL